MTDGSTALTKVFPDDAYASVLDSWSWLLGDIALQPRFTSLFGDVFLTAPDATIWFLDTVEGTLEREWSSREEMIAVLNTEEGLDHYLSGVWAMSARRLGLELGPDDVYDWTVPPVMGGAFEPSNIGVQSFVVAVDIAGQLHRQLRNLPDGTPIAGVHVEDESPKPTKRGLFGRRR